MSLTYNQVRELILKTLEERPAGTKVEVPNQQNYELALLDYFQQLETTMSTSLVGIATAETTPIEPPQARVAYLAQQASSTTTVFENFMDGEGNPISITTDVDHVAFITLFWNTQYWSYQAVMIPVIYPGGDVLTKDVVSELPETGEENVVYLIVDPKDPTAYTMHMWLNGAWATVGGAMGAVRYDQVQELTHDQENLALSNLGLDVFVMDYSQVGNALPKEKVEQLIASHAVVLNGAPNEMPRLYTRGASDSTYQNFYATGSSSTVWTLTVNKTNYNVGTPRSNPSGTPGLQSLIITVIPPVLAGDPYELGMTNKEFANALKTYNPAKQVLVVLESNTGDPDTRGNIYYPKVSRYYVAGSFYVAMVYNAISHATNVDDLILYRDVSINYDESNDRLKISDKSANLYVDTVRYGVQNLTPDQQAQARKNIGITGEVGEGAVRYDEVQDLTTDQQIQAFKNLGWDVYVTDSKSFLGSTLTPDEIERFKATSAIILTDLNRIFTFGLQTAKSLLFFSTLDISHFSFIDITLSTGLVTINNAANIADAQAVHFTAQTLTTPQQNQALANIGSGLFVIDIVDGTATLTDAEELSLLSSRGVILRGTVNAGAEVLTRIYYSDYQGGDSVNFTSPRNRDYCLLCTYTKSTKIFKFVGSVTWNDAGAVRFTPQTLTPAQQDQASSNIGTRQVILTDADFESLTDARFTLLQNALRVVYTSDGTTVVCDRAELDTSGETITWVSAPAAVRESSIKEGGYIQTDYIAIGLDTKTKALSLVPAYGYDQGAVRFDVPQDLLLEQKVQALKNIGLDYVIIEVTNGTATLTQAQEDAMIAARGVLITGSVGYEPATRRVYTLGQIDGNIVSGYSLLSGSLLLTLSYNKTTKVLTVNSASQQLIDQGAVRFNTAQSLNDTQKTQALANLGLGITLVPATVFDTAVTDAQDAQIKTAKGIIIDGIPRIYYYGNTDGDNTYFFSVNNNGMFHVLRYDTSTKLFIRPYSSYITDLTSVHFDKVQNLSDTQKAQARQNIGINLDTLLTSSSIKGVEIVNEGEAPSEQNGILYIEVKPDTNA